MIPADGHTLRWLFSQLDRCPCEGCRSTLWGPNGTQGRTQYRYCLHCGTNWKVLAIGREVDYGDARGTVVEPIAP